MSLRAEREILWPEHMFKSWAVEQLFRILKTQGLDLESSQMEHAQSFMKQAVLAIQVAVTRLQLVSCREGETGQEISDVFSQKEILLIDVLPGRQVF